MTSPRRASGARFASYWLPVLLYIGLIFGLSSVPGGLAGPWIPHVDKLEHLLEYGLFGLLLGRAFRFTMSGNGRWAWSAATVLGGAVVGALDELYQARVPRRNSDFLDWTTDLTAVALAVLFTQVVHVRPLGKSGASRGEGAR